MYNRKYVPTFLYILIAICLSMILCITLGVSRGLLQADNAGVRSNNNLAFANSGDEVLLSAEGDLRTFNKSAIPREVTLEEFGDIVLYWQLMFLRDGNYPASEEYLKEHLLKTDDFIGLEELDLSNVHINSSSIGQDKYYISDVSGLGVFSFDKLKTLNLSCNNLTEIKRGTFSGMGGLVNLDVTKNKLQTLELGILENVKNLYASENELSVVDLSSIAVGGEVNLSYNKITSLANLKLQNENRNISINLHGNKINNYTSDKYNNYNLLLGFQYEYDEYDENAVVRIIKRGVLQENYCLKLINEKTGQEIIITDSQKLIPGKYKISLCDGTVDLGFKQLELVVVKSAPKFEILDKDGNSVSHKNVIDKQITIHFNSNDELYKIKYSINGREYVEGESVMLNKSGTYSFVVMSVAPNGEKSKSTAFTVYMNLNDRNFWKTLGITMAIFAFIIVVYGVLKFVNRSSY